MNQESLSSSPEQIRDAVLSMAVESWRFGRVFDRLLLKLDAGEQNRYKSQFRWFIKKRGIPSIPEWPLPH
jgi:hypothetical protein